MTEERASWPWPVYGLYTHDGQLVVSVHVPPLNPPADVLLWGDRYFLWNEQRRQYREGVCFWIPPQLELKR